MNSIEVNLDMIDGFSDIEHINDGQTLCVVLTGKANVGNSNCVVIRSSNQIVLIDPGRFQKQADYLEKFLLRYNHPNTPVYILLTHCHLDHSSLMFRLLDHKLLKVKVIMNQLCADIFQGKTNRDLLLEAFIDRNIPLYSPDIILPGLSTSEGEPVPSHPGIGLLLNESALLKEAGIDSCRLTVNDIVIDCMHTPGHSPDSTSYQIEDVLVTGDMLFSANMGVAGVIGWSREDLRTSLLAMSRYLHDDHLIRYVMSGHGKMIEKNQALQTVEKILGSLQGMGDIRMIDGERKEKLIDISKILLKKSEVMFAALGGRLHRIEYYLNELEEEHAADMVKGLIDFDVIDEYISDFGQFARDYKTRELPSYAFYMKGIEFVTRLKKIFQMEFLNEIIDQYYLRICQRLITAYLKTAGGMVFKSPPSFNPVDLIHDMVDYVTNQRQSFDTMPEDVEDETSFTRILIQRFSYKPLVTNTPEINMYNLLDPEDPIVYADREALEDTLYSIFEYYVVKQAKVIDIRLFMNNSTINISMAAGNGVRIPQESIDFYNMLIDETSDTISADGQDILFSFKTC